MTQRLFFFIALLFVSLKIYSADFQSAIDSFCNQSSTRDANVSILFRNLDTGETIASYRPDNTVPTASTIKILTTATALEQLGDNFTFSTFLETDAQIQNGILNGNLYIRGTGDPTIGSQRVGNQNFMYQWLKALKQHGITHIKGSIIADASFYDPAEAIPYGWIREDIGNYYAAGAFPICFKDNTMTIFLHSGARGSRATIISTDPYIPDIQFENYLTCGEGRDWLVCGMPYNNHRLLSGNIAPDKGRWSVKAAIPNPPLQLARTLTSYLNANGITVDSAAQYILTPSSQPRNVLHIHQSEPLSRILTETNQESNNMYAEQIFRYLGLLAQSQQAVEKQIPTTPILINDCVNFEKQFWLNRAVNLSKAYIYDGSGLSPQDVLSARQLVDILTYMGKHSIYRDTWINTLPVSGNSGTLRGFLNDTPLEGRVIAKSGTTSRVKAYAGYIRSNDDQTYVFAIMVNNASVKSKAIQRNIARLLTQMFQ